MVVDGCGGNSRMCVEWAASSLADEGGKSEGNGKGWRSDTIGAGLRLRFGFRFGLRFWFGFGFRFGDYSRGHEVCC